MLCDDFWFFCSRLLYVLQYNSEIRWNKLTQQNLVLYQQRSQMKCPNYETDRYRHQNWYENTPKEKEKVDIYVCNVQIGRERLRRNPISMGSQTSHAHGETGYVLVTAAYWNRAGVRFIKETRQWSNLFNTETMNKRKKHAIHDSKIVSSRFSREAKQTMKSNYLARWRLRLIELEYKLAGCASPKDWVSNALLSLQLLGRIQHQ